MSAVHSSHPLTDARAEALADATAPTPLVTDPTARMEELGRIIMAYSEITEKLQQSHDQLMRQVDTLRLELSDKNRQLERRNRLAALGEMAAGMAHEIRNPLGGIQLYASLLAKDVIDRPHSHALVNKISGGVRRLESVVSQTLQLTRDSRPNLVETDLAQVVSESVELTEQQRGDSVRCEVVGPQSLVVLADANLLGQAILNLLLNAIEAVRNAGGGTVVIDYDRPKNSTEATQFRLSVTDSGPGIPSQVLDRIFNPFFTTKDTGTGLGLSIVHRIVEAHDGTISASNVDGGGARFEVKV